MRAGRIGRAGTAPARRWEIEYDGAGDRNRTDDLLFTRQLLYQLSYAGMGGAGARPGGGYSDAWARP